MGEMQRWCADCVAMVVVAVPDCAGHGGDCPELMCVSCGAAWTRGEQVLAVLVDQARLAA